MVRGKAHSTVEESASPWVLQKSLVLADLELPSHMEKMPRVFLLCRAML